MKKYLLVIFGLFTMGMMGCSDPVSSNGSTDTPSSASIDTPPAMSSSSEREIYTFNYTYRRSCTKGSSRSVCGDPSVGTYVLQVQQSYSGLWNAYFYSNGTSTGFDEDMTFSTFVNSDGTNVVSLTRTDGYFVYITDAWVHWGNKNKTTFISWSKTRAVFKRNPESEE